MAVETLRSNKMRSALTILGVVIGITSIVSMTALIRGFDESFKDLFRQIGPNTMFVTKFSFVSFSQGKEFRDLIKRPNITIEDAHAIERSPLVDSVARAAGRRTGDASGAVHLRQQRHQAHGRDRRQRQLRPDQLDPARGGRVFTQAEVDRRRNVIVLGNAPGKALFPDRPIRSASRSASAAPSTPWSACSASGPIRSAATRPTSSRSSRTRRWQKVYGADALRIFGIVHRDVSIIVIPRDERAAGRRDARGRGDHAGAARPPPRSGERLRHRHAGRAVQGLGADQAAASSWRWSSSRRSR